MELGRFAAVTVDSYFDIGETSVSGLSSLCFGRFAISGTLSEAPPVDLENASSLAPLVEAVAEWLPKLGRSDGSG